LGIREDHEKFYGYLGQGGVYGPGNIEGHLQLMWFRCKSQHHLSIEQFFIPNPYWF